MFSSRSSSPSDRRMGGAADSLRPRAARARSWMEPMLGAFVCFILLPRGTFGEEPKNATEEGRVVVAQAAPKADGAARDGAENRLRGRQRGDEQQKKPVDAAQKECDLRAFAPPDQDRVDAAVVQIWILAGIAIGGALLFFVSWWWFYEPRTASTLDSKRHGSKKPAAGKSPNPGEKPKARPSRGNDDDDRDENGRYVLN